MELQRNKCNTIINLTLTNRELIGVPVKSPIKIPAKMIT